MDKIKQSLEYIQNHLNVILLVPTVLGGFWQLIELMSIDTSYLRFFSLTQVIADGLIILIILLFSYFIYLLFFKLVFEDNKLETNKSDLAFNIFRLLSFTVLLIYFLYKIYINKKIEFSNFLLVIFCIVGIYRYIREILKNSNKINNKLKEIIVNNSTEITLFLMLAIGFLFVGFITFNKLFHNTYFIPTNLKNITNIECYLDKKKNEFELLYFNDNYIFVEIKDTQQVEIIKFEELLNKENCK